MTLTLFLKFFHFNFNIFFNFVDQNSECLLDAVVITSTG